MDDINIFEIERQKIESISVVYFLFRKGELVYVGKSDHLLKRVASHAYSQKDFDEFSYIRVDKYKVDEIEARLIEKHKPEYNIRGIEEKTPQKYSTRDTPIPFSIEKMTSDLPLNDRQQEIWDFIVFFNSENGIMPSPSQIAAATKRDVTEFTACRFFDFERKGMLKKLTVTKLNQKEKP